MFFRIAVEFHGATSTVGCFAVYYYYVASSISLHTNGFLVASGITMTVCFILSRRKPSFHYNLHLAETEYSKHSMVNLENSNKLTLCEVCSHTVPQRAKHCRICKCCILKYDHHCVWLDCCIGYHNHKIFLFTVFLYLVNIFTGCLVSISFACKWDDGLIADCSHAYSSDSSALVFVVCCYMFVAGVALSILLIQQLFLISFNVTSNEWRRMQPGQQSCWSTITSSPHNKGILRNWSEFLRT